MHSRQRGISFIAFLIVLAVGGFFLYLGMRIGPTYLEYWTIRTAVNEVAAEAGTADIAELRRAMDRRMTIDYAGSFRPEFIRVVREGDQINLVLHYEIRRPLIHNLDFVARFDHSAPIRQP
ncbi:DUF4845 domain-containing protein [Silanimonas sp.]|uniref:DUF4845 domain-containing protein n=1 Tax=Silanimonas sp. TaxID=1929290 RepID=UPI001BBEF2CE|nr:DUF4845 domain-containing protein [Silanimonas sp.]MBS3895619.1 DUF4845 domain-containing protein [Silanimonas sp.]MBS3924298.1 DUF4845 domain-containing protein [Xanthomonadaceae bacterium]